MWFLLDPMLQGGNSQSEPEEMGPSSSPGAGGVSEGSQGSELRRASSQSVLPSFSEMSQNARESMGVLGEGLKQLFQQQRKRLSLSRSTIPSSSSSSSSFVVSAGDTSPLAREDTFVSSSPEYDHLSAPVILSAAGQGPAAAGMMRRGTSLQSRRSKGSWSGDRDPLLRSSPQAPQRRNTHDPQQHISRPHSSSTTDTTPSSPAPGYTGGDVGLSSGYQSTEETDRVSGSSHSLSLHRLISVFPPHLLMSGLVCQWAVNLQLRFTLLLMCCDFLLLHLKLLLLLQRLRSLQLPTLKVI